MSLTLRAGTGHLAIAWKNPAYWN